MKKRHGRGNGRIPSTGEDVDIPGAYSVSKTEIREAYVKKHGHVIGTRGGPPFSPIGVLSPGVEATPSSATVAATPGAEQGSGAGAHAVASAPAGSVHSGSKCSYCKHWGHTPKFCALFKQVMTAEMWALCAAVPATSDTKCGFCSVLGHVRTACPGQAALLRADAQPSRLRSGAESPSGVGAGSGMRPATPSSPVPGTRAAQVAPRALNLGDPQPVRTPAHSPSPGDTESPSSRTHPSAGIASSAREAIRAVTGWIGGAFSAFMSPSRRGADSDPAWSVSPSLRTPSRGGGASDPATGGRAP